MILSPALNRNLSNEEYSGGCVLGKCDFVGIRTDQEGQRSRVISASAPIGEDRSTMVLRLANEQLHLAAARLGNGAIARGSGTNGSL